MFIFTCIVTITIFIIIALQVFDDAYKSPLSLVIVDDIERLLGKYRLSLVIDLSRHSYSFLSSDQSSMITVFRSL